MKKSFKKYEKAGLPGGPNELKRFTQGFIISQRGQWDYPGLPTAVPTPTGKITMKGVEDDLLGIDNLGNAQYMTPGNEYQFEGDMVYEIPQAKKGGSKKYPKKYSRSLMARNILFTKNPLFKKSKSVKNKIFDPNSPYFQDGGITKLSPEEEIEFQKFYATLPENLQTDDATYDIRGYWDSEGRPEKFNYDQPKESDGYYHAYSINQNTGEYLKSPAHETFQHAVDEDRKIGYRPIPNVYGRNIATENSSIADSDAQSFLRNMIGAPSYIELELDDNQIEEYRKGGYIIEDISVPSLTRMDNGGNPIKQLQEKEKAAELSRLIASGAAAYGANDGANYKSGGLIEKKSSLLKADDGIEISDNSLFNDKLQEIADELGVTVDDLVGIMQHESRLNPSAVNPYTGAVGLIQFMPNTAKGLGTSIDALKQMSAIDQLDYVKKFYKPIAGKAKDIGDLYMYTFLPAAVGKPDDFVIGVKDSDSKVFGINQDALYKQNAVFDSEKKGYYTVGDVKKRISNFTGKSLTAPNRKKTIKRIPGKVEDTVKVIKRKHYVDSDKKEETIPVDPRIEQLAAFSKIMAPTSENIFQLYNQGMSSQMKYGGLTKMDKGGGIQGIEGLKEDFADRLSQFINDAKSQGINLKIGSGYRSYEKQKQLWEDALKKYGSAEVARKWVAPPGSSYHNKGLAVDLHDENSRALGKEENQEATAWAHANAKKYGLHFRMGNEPWHIEPIEFTGEDHEHTDENDITGDILIPDLQTESKVEYDDDYSDWSPNKKEVVTSDPRLQQLEAFSKIISPSSQNINMMFQDAIKGNMKKGGFILEVDDRDIQKYLDGGYIVEEID